MQKTNKKTAMMINSSVTTDAALINIGNVIMIMIVEMDLTKPDVLSQNVEKDNSNAIMPGDFCNGGEVVVSLQG